MLARFLKAALSRGTAATSSTALLLEQAIAHERRGELVEAKASLQHALKVEPAHVPAMVMLGVLHAKTDNLAAARHMLEDAVALAPSDAGAANALGNVCKLQKKWGEAMAHYRKAIALNPEFAPALSNLGVCLKNEGRPLEAVAFLRRACGVAPASPEALLNLGLGLIEAGEPAAGEEHLAHALRVAPEMAEVHLALAFQLLKAGRFEEGWREYEWRRRVEERERRHEYPFPRWHGDGLHTSTILVRAEQGLGDQIMFASCLPEIVARARLTLIECDARLKPLFARSFPRAEVYVQRQESMAGRWAGAQEPDCQTDMGSLPGMLQWGSSWLPRAGAYLRADPNKIAKWRARVSALGAKCVIGLSWRGGTPHTRQHARSMPLAELLPICNASGIRCVSLQYGDCEEEISEFRRAHGVALEHWREAIADYDETAALVSALDGVVSVQTAVVHLAGALGKRTWVLLPSVPEWRYLERDDRMAWYPSVSLHRRECAGTWQDVVMDVTERLAALVHFS